MKSWRTTLFGAGGLLAVMVSTLQFAFDGDPKTEPDWLAFCGACSTAWALFNARDHKITSEQAGAGLAKP